MAARGLEMGIEFGILGPLEVRVDGVAVAVGGPRQRALLAMLLLSANSVVSRDQLIDELLQGAPVDSADHMLRVQVSRLRKVLMTNGGGDGRLIARAPGYLVRVQPGELDLRRFEDLLAEGHRALQDEEFESASRTLRAADSLWRGRPLADLEFERFARVEIERLQELRLAAAEERIEAELALGRHAMLVPELEALVAGHPLRERPRGQLMVALYRCGRQADALQSYRSGRALLNDELALEPSPALRQLEQAILVQNAALDLPRAAERGRVAAAGVAPEEESRDEEQPDLSAALYEQPRRRRRWVVASAAAAVVLAAVGFAVTRGGSKPRAALANGNALALFSPKSGSVLASVPLAAPPSDIAAGFGSLWVAEPGAGVVARVDPGRRTVLATIPAGTPTRVIAAGGEVWALDPVDGTASRIDPSTDSVAQTIAVGPRPSDLVFSGASLWVANQGEGTVTRIDSSSGRTQMVVRTGGDPSGLATAPGVVWVADDGSGMVDRIDARTGRITNTIRVGDAPTAIAVSGGTPWVLDPWDATVARVDPRRDVVRATIPLGGEPTSLTLSGGSVWLADERRDLLLQLDPRRNLITRAIRLGGRPSALSVAGGLWAAVATRGADHSGGTLTAAASYQVIDTLDPAAGTSNNVSPPQFLGMTNDGLVTVAHLAGQDGTRLVPDLALSLPLPSNAGRTYTFQLRPGIRYSTGAALRASDVTHSFDRLFAIGSSGTSWYQSIVGAAGCLRRPAGCDLARGIVANDRTGTVTFHLTRADPDFLYKLTLTYADVLPSSTPDRQAQGPLPATGPYVVSRYVPGHEVLLTRNPRFREWSTVAQPQGYPDRVRLQLDLAGANAARSVASGTADFTANLGAIPSAYAGYFLSRHRTQVRVNPDMETSFMFLNVRTPPFDDVRVRQALNLALDRARIVDTYGGTVAAQPTCQVLPPGIPGYRRYCPYTRNPGRDGRWHGPNLSDARRLVAASHTTGMTVTVWNTPSPPEAVAETKDAVTALRQLGYRASLRILPDNTYFTYTADSRNHAQVIDGGWSADYASADDFLGKLTCSYFLPGNGLATINSSESCLPAIDRQIQRADTQQTTDATAAATSWSQIDRELTNLAILLPTVTPDEVDLISHRVRNYQYNPAWGVLLDQLWVR
jgi:ABC-type transport system substrate-binding protein/DNA-binding SARP family transcriptional activator